MCVCVCVCVCVCECVRVAQAAHPEAWRCKVVMANKGEQCMCMNVLLGLRMLGLSTAKIYGEEESADCEHAAGPVIPRDLYVPALT